MARDVESDFELSAGCAITASSSVCLQPDEPLLAYPSILEVEQPRLLHVGLLQLALRRHSYHSYEALKLGHDDRQWSMAVP